MSKTLIERLREAATDELGRLGDPLLLREAIARIQKLEVAARKLSEDPSCERSQVSCACSYENPCLHMRAVQELLDVLDESQALQT